MKPTAALLLFLAATLALRLVSIFATGFCDDEAYVVTVSRAPALSYFDHPPLHQWVLAAWTHYFGEGRAARLPFLGFSLVTAFALAGLARRLFSDAAAGWTLFVFSASAYFLVYPDGYILPDPPLFAFSSLAIWGVAEILFRPPGRSTLLWLGVGLALGLAGLSKYAAFFVPLGLAGFFLSDAKARRWLADPRPYLAGLLALACQTPTWLWNSRHDWISLAFQSSRVARAPTFTAKALTTVLECVGEQIASMTPWLFIPLMGGFWLATRQLAGRRERFLLWQAAPPLLLFALMPLAGQRPIGHWFNSGWLFAFPLAGCWLAERSPRFLSGFARLAGGLTFAVFAVYLAAVLAGPFSIPGLRDPTRAMFDFPPEPLRAAYARAGADFVLIDNWRTGGRVGVALGPKIPVCALGRDPRGFAFACDAGSFVGRNAFIARESANETDASGFFRAVETLGALPVGRQDVPERVLTVEAGRELLRAPPLPYGP